MDPRPTEFFLDLPVAQETSQFPPRFSVQDGMAAHFHLTTQGQPHYEHPLCRPNAYGQRPLHPRRRVAIRPC